MSDPQGHANKLEAAFDPRLADVWLAVFQSDVTPADLPPHFGWFLRMAYLQGYEDALSEPDSDGLYKSLGVRPPRRSGPRARRTRR